jgi:hypothetical protein
MVPRAAKEIAMTTTFEVTPVPESAPESKPKKGKKAKASAAASETPASEPAQEEPAPEPTTPEPKRKKSTPKRPAKGPCPEMTLRELCEHYLAHLETTKSKGTCTSYAMELSRACEYLKDDTMIGTLAPADIARFNGSLFVMFKKDGKTRKAAPSYLKTRRVLRLALVWAANDRKWLESAPIPVETAESK